MYKRTLAGIIAGTIVFGCTAINLPTSAEGGNYNMQVNVNLDGTKTSISPYIYGINNTEGSTSLKNVTTTALRAGGNRYTAYNWETNWSNAGSDWKNSSDTNMGDVSNGPAYQARQLSSQAEKAGVDYKILGLEMAGYVSADKNGTVSESEAAPSSRWNKLEFRKNSELSLEPDLTDDSVYMDEYINYIVQTLGDSTTSTGIQGYLLDNEPALWDSTHSLIHSENFTNEELVSKSVELAKVIKEIDPNAEVYGPAFWGMLPCINAAETGDSFSDSGWDAVKSNYNWYADYYLEQMKKADKECGTRLLDCFDVHYYAQDCSTEDGILQAARSLYDEDYVENSWLQPYYGKYFPFLPNLQKSIDEYYPGTKLTISEYNLGNISNEASTGSSVVTALAETEALGAFAMNNVYLATYWGTMSECPYVQSAINLYTNYDGNGSSFGDTLIESTTEDLSKAAVFSSINGSNENKVTICLSNKSKTDSEVATISLNNATVDYQSATIYAITQDNSEIRVIDVQNGITNNTVQVELPALSVAQIVVSTERSEASITQEPNTTTKEVTYQLSELSESENGYISIPLTDTEHLTKIILDYNAYSTEGSSYYSGGGGLCFNHFIADGTTEETWACKSFTFKSGVSQTTVEWDNTFSVPEGDSSVEQTGITNDTYIEFQPNWWKYSEKSDSGADISVNYNTVTLVYEYDEDEEPAITTTTETSTTTTTEVITTTTELTTTSEITTTEKETTDEITTTTTETTETTITKENIDSVLYGDMNLDQSVDLSDVIVLNKIVAQLITPTEQQSANGDLDTNSTIDATDGSILLKYNIHVITALPYTLN